MPGTSPLLLAVFFSGFFFCQILTILIVCYWHYRIVSRLSILKVAPDVPAARRLLKDFKNEQEPQAGEIATEEEHFIDPSNLSDEALENIRQEL